MIERGGGKGGSGGVGALGIKEGWRGALLFVRGRLLALKGSMTRICSVDDLDGVVVIVSVCNSMPCKGSWRGLLSFCVFQGKLAPPGIGSPGLTEVALSCFYVYIRRYAPVLSSLHRFLDFALLLRHVKFEGLQKCGDSSRGSDIQRHRPGVLSALLSPSNRAWI